MKTIFAFVLFLGVLFLVNAKKKDSALDSLLKELSDAKIEKNKEKEADVYNKLGNYYLDNKELNKAIKEFQNEVSVRKKYSEYETYTASNLNLAKVLTLADRHTEAIKIFENVLETATSINYLPAIKECYLQLSKSYRAIGVNSKANQYIHSYNSFEIDKENQMLQDSLVSKDSTLSEAIEKTIEQKKTLTQKELEVLEKNKAINSLSKEKQLQQQLIEKQKQSIKDEKTISRLLIAVVGLFIIMLTIFVYFYLQRRKASRIIEEQNQKITGSINHAFKIQSGILPKEQELNSVFGNDVLVYYKPMSIVSGDFYFMHKTSENEFYIAAIDCTGHGVPGSLTAMLGYGLLSEIVVDTKFSSTNDILDELHRRIVKALNQEQTGGQEGMDLALCKINLSEKYIEFSGARNPLLYFQNNEQFIVKADKRPIGGVIKKEFKPFTSTKIDITEPTTFYIYTDGYQDQIGADNESKYLSKHFAELLKGINAMPFVKQTEILEKEYKKWKGQTPQNDDICIIGFRVS